MKNVTADCTSSRYSCRMKRWLLVLGVLVGFGAMQLSLSPVLAQEKFIVETFVRDDCSHCHDQEKFFDEQLEKGKELEVKYLDIDVQENKDLWEKVVQKEGISKSTPITLVGATVIAGFDKPETTGERILELVEKQGSDAYVGFEKYLELEVSDLQVYAQGQCEDECELDTGFYKVSLPFVGVIDTSTYSLPLLASVLGFIDGFNPCAMWVLVTFLVVLSQLKSKKKMWIFAGTFMLAEAIMYALILVVWFSTWDFVGLDRVVTPLVGLLALGGGSFFLWEWKNTDGTCQVGDLAQKARTRNRIKDLAKQPFTLVTFIGVLGLAFSVNIIEFACSIGIPQAFTKILELNQLGFFRTFSLIGTYILFYMVDDLIVFGIALYSFEKIGITTKYSRMSSLIGGILMIGLGAMLLLKPQLLIMGIN